MGRDQVSEESNVLSANVLWKPLKIRKIVNFGNKV